MKDSAFGNRVRLLRKKNGMLQEEAAAAIGIKYKTYQTHEAGQWPSRKTRQKYLDFYGCNASWFLTGEGVPYNKGMREDIRTEDPRFPWAKMRYIEVGGQAYDIQELSPRGNQTPPDPPTDPFLRGVGALRTIFDSGDPLLISAIQANLTAFEQAAANKQYLGRQSERIQKLEEECEDLKKKIESLEKIIGAGDALAGQAKSGTDSEV